MAEVGRRSGGYEPARYGSPSAAARRQARLAASGSPRSPSAAARTQLQGSSPSTSTTSWASPASSPRRTARSPSRRAAGNRSSPQRTAHLTTIPRLQLAESGGVGGQGENALGETLSLMQRLGGPGADTLTDAELRSSLDARPKLQLRPLRSMQHFLEFEQAVARVASLNQQEQDEASAARETALTQVDEKLSRARHVVERDSWERRHASGEAGGGSTAKPGSIITRAHVTASMLSPAAVEAVVAERNALREQLYDMSAEMLRTRELWNVELEGATASSRRELAESILLEANRLRRTIEKDILEQRREMQALVERHEEDQALLRKLSQRAETQNLLMKKRLKESEADEALLRHAIHELRMEMEAAHGHASVNLEKAIEQLRQHAEESKNEAMREQEEEHNRAMHAFARELELRHREDTKIQVQNALARQEKELREQARLEADEAVERALAAVKATGIDAVVEQREKMEKTHKKYTRSLHDRVRQQAEILATSTRPSSRRSSQYSTMRRDASLTSTVGSLQSTMRRSMDLSDTMLDSLDQPGLTMSELS